MTEQHPQIHPCECQEQSDRSRPCATNSSTGVTVLAGLVPPRGRAAARGSPGAPLVARMRGWRARGFRPDARGFQLPRSPPPPPISPIGRSAAGAARPTKGGGIEARTYLRRHPIRGHPASRRARGSPPRRTPSRTPPPRPNERNHRNHERTGEGPPRTAARREPRTEDPSWSCGVTMRTAAWTFPRLRPNARRSSSSR